MPAFANKPERLDDFETSNASPMRYSVPKKSERPMEVHPPEHGIHSWRDFLVHMGTITLGLLIALGLEAAAEALHHHHQLVEARERIHAEIEENRRTIAHDRALLQKSAAAVRANITLLDAVGPLDSSQLSFGWQWDGTDSAAWQTAQATGALALMPYGEVQQYSGLYAQQGSVTEAAKDYIHAQEILLQPLLRHGDLQDHGHFAPIQLTPDERKTLADSSTDSIAKINLLQDLINSLDKLYANGK